MKNNNIIISFHGVNNIGKTTQINLLKDYLKSLDLSVEVIKFPAYDYGKTGQLITDYVKNGNPLKLTPSMGQALFGLNRAEFQPEMKKLLENSILLTENYAIEKYAFGLTAGISEDFLDQCDIELSAKEDLSILMIGNIFEESVEQNHIHEGRTEFMSKVQQTYIELKQKRSDLNWIEINANQDRKVIFELIKNEVDKIIF